MNTPPLAIVQARVASTRLPGKMLLPLGDYPLVCWAIHAAVTAFGREHVVAALPATAENDELADVIRDQGDVRVFRWDGPEDDVLGRFWHCAHTFRWNPETIIVRVTPDDPFKRVDDLRRVAAGERLPVETGGEAFTLRCLDDLHRMVAGDLHSQREHLTTLFSVPPPPPPPGLWTIDTQEQYDEACRLVDTGRIPA